MTVTIYMTTSAYEGEPDKPTMQTCIDEQVPDCWELCPLMEFSSGHVRITRSALINGSYTNNAAAYI
jgi:hypothetical protein